MKKLLCIFICIFTLCCAASADWVGTINTTDIKAFINYMYVPTYNFGGTTVVFVRDLENYGYAVDWRESTRSVILYKSNAEIDFEPALWQYLTPAEVNMKMYDVYSSDIKVYFANGTIPSYNIDGKVAVALRDIDIMMNIQFDEAERTACLRVGMDELTGKKAEYIWDYFYKNQFLLAEGDYYHIKTDYMLREGRYDKNLMAAFENYLDRLSENIEAFREYEEPEGFSESSMEIWWAMINGRYASQSLYEMGLNLRDGKDDPKLAEEYAVCIADSKAQRSNSIQNLKRELENPVK